MLSSRRARLQTHPRPTASGIAPAVRPDLSTLSQLPAESTNPRLRTNKRICKHNRVPRLLCMHSAARPAELNTPVHSVSTRVHGFALCQQSIHCLPLSDQLSLQQTLLHTSVVYTGDPWCTYCNPGALLPSMSGAAMQSSLLDIDCWILAHRYQRLYPNDVACRDRMLSLSITLLIKLSGCMCSKSYCV